MKAQEAALGGSMLAPVPHETVIQPNQSWLHLEWSQVWEYRDLLLLLVHREFASKYKQTILGPVWFVLQPLLTSLVFTIFFGRVTQMPTDGIPPFIFFLCNQLGWNYLQQNLNTAGAIFTTNAYIFGKVYFPRIVVPLSTVFSNLFASALQLFFFFLIYCFTVFFLPGATGLHMTPAALFVPFLFLHTAALSLGVCLWLSSLTAKYRDLNQLLQLITQMWMFASPVLYPLSKFAPKWRWLVELNPMTAILEAFRLCLIGYGTVTAGSMLLSLAMTVVILLSGILVFQRTERTFIDTV